MKVTKITACAIPLLFAGGCTLDLANVSFGIDIMVISILIVFALPFVAIIDYAVDRKRNPEKYRLKSERRKATRERIKKEWEAREAEQLKKEEKRRYDNSIVEAKIIGGGSTVNKTHGLGGAIVGGALFGVPGAIVGSALPKGSEQKVRFAVKYGSGKVVIMDLHPNSWEYKEVIKHVKFEDLK